MDIPLNFMNIENFYPDNITPFFLEELLPLDEEEDSRIDFIFDNSNKIPKYKFKTMKPRRRKEDYLRKKAKTCSHKSIISDINNKLKKAGSKHTFEPFPHHFIGDITQKTNYKAMQLTFIELFDFTHNNLINDKKYWEKDYNQQAIKVAENKYNKNKKTLAYLDSNTEISKKSGWEKIKNVKYVDLLNEYFDSNEFEQFVQELSKKEDEEYIKSFKYFSKTYTQYFLSCGKNEENNKIQTSSIINKIPDFSEQILPNLTTETPFLLSEENDLYEIFNFNRSEDLSDENSLFPNDSFIIRRL